MSITSFSDLHGLGPADVRKQMGSYQAGLQDDPNDVSCHSSLAMCYLKLELYGEAEQHFQRAIDVEPDNSELYFYAALAVLGGKRPFNAGLQTVKRAVGLVNAASRLENRSSYSLFMAYLCNDYFVRRFLSPPTPEYDLVAAARAAGMSASDRQLLSEMLGDGFATYCGKVLV